MSWFKRTEKGITTPTEEKREVPDGLWYQCPECKKVVHTREHEEHAWTCVDCNYHARVGSKEYFELFFDNNEFTELDAGLSSGDPLKFIDSQPYPKRIIAAQAKTGLTDAVRTGFGKVGGKDAVICCMDFTFIGGSMGSVVGEKISRGIDAARAKKVPFIMICKSGGARMMEAGFSLMQMAKTSARLALLSEEKLPYISILTDPTTGGVTASYAMLGDINIAEPGALIGFAGPRVVRETIGKDLPAGFQTSEFLLEHGFLDFIVDRKIMKKQVSDFLRMVKKK
ncbi:acetyl-CoA carboxylase, carboxyltransferase subunit beta [uncultured Cytophaga sp.]|uniref:acetyl-CoA carboxylase, carboxyltransferase subunit beta n=1 Tax=uncultured Cytophaga sp. TaxID=160238 RepID=UPI00260A6D1A|nr:acetyl-CoA carboxylase, carboxyltransferase subunit beta [uncultured Cytophaga sp.]